LPPIQLSYEKQQASIELTSNPGSIASVLKISETEFVVQMEVPEEFRGRVFNLTIQVKETGGLTYKDYNFRVKVSETREAVPRYQKSGLKLEFADYSFGGLYKFTFSQEIEMPNKLVHQLS